MPLDIYARGIPNSTRVDDLRPSPEVLALLKTYRDYRNNAPARYAVASIFDFEQSAHAIHPGKELFGYVSIMYEDQRNRYHRLDSIIQMKAQYASPMGNTFAAINNWCHQTNATVPDSIYLWDGMYHYETSYNTDKNIWEAQSQKKDRPGNQLSFLQQKGWPTIASNAQQSSAIQYKIIKDDYSEAHNLICIEKLNQGFPNEGTHQGMPPTRHLYYLNPDRDYICQRHEEYRSINGPWQQDTSWLNGVDPNHIRRDATIIIQTSEYAQTSEMKWYPKVVIRTGNGSASDGTATTIIETSLFEDQVDLPDGIFDPKKLTDHAAR